MMKMGNQESRFHASNPTRARVTYDQITNKGRKWNLTDYGNALRKRKTRSFFSSENKVTKVSSTSTDPDSNNGVTLVEYNSVSTASSCCCSSDSSSKSDFKVFTFDLSTYNLLAPALALENSYLYSHVPNDFINWYFRRAKIYDEVKYFDFDIYCFQEMQEDEYYNYFFPKFKSIGYYCLFKKRTGNKPDGCCIIFKKRKFHLISYEFVEYFSPNVEVLSKENVAIIALLQPKYGPTSEKICIATTHLIFSPKRGDVKLAQIQKLLAHIDRIAFKRVQLVNNEIKIVYYPVILCGDMNLTPNSTIYKFLTESELLNYQQYCRKSLSGQFKHRNSSNSLMNRPIMPEVMQINDHSIFKTDLNKRFEEFTARLNQMESKHKTYLEYGSENLYHTFKFKSAYELKCFGEQPNNDVTTALPKNHEKVDYIFYHEIEEDNDESGEVNEDKYGDDAYLKLNSVLNLYQKDDIENLYFPSRHIPSDHFILSAKFSLLYKTPKTEQLSKL